MGERKDRRQEEIAQTPIYKLRRENVSALCFEVEYAVFTAFMTGVSTSTSPELPTWAKMATGAMAVMAAGATIFLDRERRTCAREIRRREGIIFPNEQ